VLRRGVFGGGKSDWLGLAGSARQGRARCMAASRWPSFSLIYDLITSTTAVDKMATQSNRVEGSLSMWQVVYALFFGLREGLRG
jgi:hypothetical protein